ncbi:lactosylceramide 4-alpha-galactosyltransferase-like [Abrus precatorius]|uniref:Lactosylceramide 4-alpha-galactosyltransferase-like n=1 Tax=Abrus precatorius TaxID=3816 RepID=A0A8B8JYE5_ABRPR|nr:lactosylceramide 4-alpha-galactosyltransferase-like [Abrus precatorius]
MFAHRLHKHTKLSIFSLITFSAIIFLIHADSIIYHDSLHSKAITREPEKLQVHNPSSREGISLRLTHIPLHSIQEKDEAETNQNALVAPLNVTEEERITWFREHLHKFKILNSSNLTRQFHARVLGFFSQECQAQFFMTWISPARLFGGRELLSVESVFKVHPKACLIILSRTLDTRHGYRILKPLLDCGFKVQAVTPDLSFLFKRTPAEAWFRELRKGRKDPGEISLSQNLSNLIRLAVLYKYGGVYIDTDFIVLKPLTRLRNSIGAQSMNLGSTHWSRLNNAVLIFDMRHPLLHRFINEFALTFDGNKWGHNGPYLVSRVIKRLGKKHDFNLTILPPVAFYPVDWNKISGLFMKPNTQGESRWVEAKLLQLSGKTYGVHLWNKHSSRLTIEEGSVIGRLVSNHYVICNHTYSS